MQRLAALVVQSEDDRESEIRVRTARAAIRSLVPALRQFALANARTRQSNARNVRAVVAERDERVACGLFTRSDGRPQRRMAALVAMAKQCEDRVVNVQRLARSRRRGRGIRICKHVGELRVVTEEGARAACKRCCLRCNCARRCVTAPNVCRATVGNLAASIPDENWCGELELSSGCSSGAVNEPSESASELASSIALGTSPRPLCALWRACISAHRY